MATVLTTLEAHYTNIDDADLTVEEVALLKQLDAALELLITAYDEQSAEQALDTQDKNENST